MTKKLEKLEVAAVSPFGTTSLPCGLCGGPHDIFNNNIQNNNGPYQPNFSWGGNQGQRSNNNIQNNNGPYQPPFQQQQQPFQQPPPPVPPQQKPSSSTPPNSIEAALEKLAQSTASFVQNTHSFMNETRSTFKNQESTLRNLENQVVVNPKEVCKAVTLRSGKVLVDNSDKKVEEKGEDKIVEDSPVKSTTEGAKPLSAPSSSLQIPFPQRLRKDGEDSNPSIILGRPFLATGRALIDV
ncbi:hypothetical protein PIB30_077093 [Stylosanthes scabra]|uniref:Uncharacterized protein n=1 Tax=Stylosanthes scabra TaxID=79078 RepID=A0ABU6WT85_9FABA|nr:hypothetical protein [Stylosanthes scabra]